MALAIDVEALRAKVAGLSFALARECELRQAAERERDAVIGLFVTPNAGTYVVFLNNNWRRYDSYKSAVAAVRAAAGLDAERSDRAD